MLLRRRENFFFIGDPTSDIGHEMKDYCVGCSRKAFQTLPIVLEKLALVALWNSGLRPIAVKIAKLYYEEYLPLARARCPLTFNDPSIEF